MKILHILNGDATAANFGQTGLEGDTLVWRELLSEGPLTGTISSAGFWSSRMEWICKGFNQTPESYRQKTLDELAKLNEPYGQINLWFEFDLHCQANLLAVMAYLGEKTDLSAPAIYLICPGDFPNRENFQGMGQLTAAELAYLYDHIRLELSKEDFEIARSAWEVYAEKDAQKLQAFLLANHFWGSLHFLRPALLAQLKRLEVNQAGLNYVEQKLLDIYNSGMKTKQQLYAAFWASEQIYGMGDAEIDIYLARLKEKRLL